MRLMVRFQVQEERCSEDEKCLMVSSEGVTISSTRLYDPDRLPDTQTHTVCDRASRNRLLRSKRAKHRQSFPSSTNTHSRNFTLKPVCLCFSITILLIIVRVSDFNKAVVN